MKTAIELIEKDIAELWSSPSDTPTYSQIFKVLEMHKPKFREQIESAFSVGFINGISVDIYNVQSSKDYYEKTFNL